MSSGGREHKNSNIFLVSVFFEAGFHSARPLCISLCNNRSSTAWSVKQTSIPNLLVNLRTLISELLKTKNAILSSPDQVLKSTRNSSDASPVSYSLVMIVDRSKPGMSSFQESFWP